MSTDTIAAIATPLGHGGISILRMSGPEAFLILQKVFSKDVSKMPSHTMTLGHLLGDDRTILDQVLAVVFREGRSFTGEDVVEIHLHGGLWITKKALSLLLHQGARLAKPGEFSLRAFLQGKMDLSEAEAIMDIIHAPNDAALKAAEEQLKGRISREIRTLQSRIVDHLALIEAHIDYPEENLEKNDHQEMIISLEKTYQYLKKLANSFHDGKKLLAMPTLSLIGKPNVGKSSLLNALLEKERAIVTEIAGTTRDCLEEPCIIGGVEVCLTDTAGIRQTEEIVEQHGIERARQKIQTSDLILYVTEPMSSLDELLEELPQEKTLVVVNKIDMHPSFRLASDLPQVYVSAKEKQHLDELKTAIERFFHQKRISPSHEVLLTKERHFIAVKNAMQGVLHALTLLKKNSDFELISIELRSAISSLSEIIGINVTEEVLSSIFSKFCVGK